MKGPIFWTEVHTRTISFDAGVRVVCQIYMQVGKMGEARVSVLWPGGEWTGVPPGLWGARNGGFFLNVNRAVNGINVDQESDVSTLIAAIKKATGTT